MRRAEILRRQHEILMTARNENRAMTEDEIAEFDDLQRELEELDARSDGELQTREEAGSAAQQENTDPMNAAQRAIQDERIRVSEITGLAQFLAGQAVELKAAP